MSLNPILSSDNTPLDLTSHPFYPEGRTLTGLPLGTPASSASGEVGVKVVMLGGSADNQTPQHDYLGLAYTSDNLTQVVYKRGGSGGTTVRTINMGYSGSNLTSVTYT